jgi:hypothetical protein
MNADQQVLPCGCVIRRAVVDGRREFQIVPCHLDCRYLAYAIEESQRQGKPVETRRAP